MLSEVPEGWRLLPLGDFATIKNGFAFKSKDFVSDEASGFDVSLVVRMSDFNGGYVDISRCKRIHKDKTEGLEKFKLNQVDILVAMSGATVGKLGRVPATLSELYLNQRVGCLQPTQCSGEFLWQLVNTPLFQTAVLGAATGNAQPNISSKELEKIQLVLPPEEEQQRISEILSSVDASIQATQAVIEQAERVKRGFVRERILGGLTPEEIFEGEAPENSELKTIAQATENLNKRRIPIKKSERQGGEYPYYGATGIIDYVKDYIFDERILLISEDGANLVDKNYPIAYSVEGKTWVNNHAHVLKVESPAQQKVLEEFFNEVPLTKFLTGMAQPKLNKAVLSSIPVPVFSETEAAILAEAIAALDASIASNRANITQLQAVKNGLMDDLLTGRVRAV